MRDGRFDFYKGMLIWGVIWGHTITAFLNGQVNDLGIHPILRTYDMPLFMVISGYFFSFSIKRYNLGKLLQNKVTTIAFPAIFWALTLHFGKENPLSSFYFVWAVFWSSFLVAIINNFINNNLYQISIYILITLALHFIPINSYTIYNLPYLFPYFLIGYYAWHYIERIRKYSLYIFLIFIILLCYWHTDYTIWNIGANLTNNSLNVLRAIFLRTFIALTGIIVAITVFDLIYSFLSENYPLIKNFFVSIGKETLGLYILQGFFVFRIIGYFVRILEKTIGFNIFASNHLLLGYFLAPSISLIVIAILYTFISSCKKYRYLKLLFGFKL